MLGPIGMGIMLPVDSPTLGNNTLYTYNEVTQREDHGTRAAPSEIPLFIDLHFHVGTMMNTTASDSSTAQIQPAIPGPSVIITLQKPLLNDFFVENPSPGFPMVAKVVLSGTGNVDVTVRDNSGGQIVGQVTYPETGDFTFGGTPQPVNIDIPFSSVSNYTFAKDHVIEIEFSFTNTGRLHYDSTSAPSRLTLYGITVPDITFETANFNGEPTDTFYPKDINFPQDVNRKEVQMRGKITEVFGKENALQYVDTVEVIIDPPSSSNITRTCDYNKNTFEYEYTWTYIYGQEDGEYFVTTRVIDEQGNEFTIMGNFYMSAYGVLLTSPSQDPEEGTYRAEARRQLVENSVTTYDVNIYNIGNNATSVDITTIGSGGWDWWIGGTNLTINNNKTGRTLEIPSGGSPLSSYLGITFSVDAMSNQVGSPPTTNIITGSSFEEPTESSALTTISTVVYEFDIDLEFSEGGSTIDAIVETGDSIEHNFIVTNNGEGEDRVYLDLSSAPAGWSASLSGSELQGSSSQYYVDLESGDPAEITLMIQTPTGGDEVTVDIEVTGKSRGSMDQGDDPVVSDKITASTTTTKGISLILNDVPEKEVDPEQDIAFEFRVTNTGTTIANISVSFTGPGSSDGWASNDISLSPSGFENEKSFFNLAPSNPQTFWLYVEPSANVLAGNYSMAVKAENIDQSTRFEQLSVFSIVTEYYKIEIGEPLSLDFNEEAEPGDDVELTIIIENNGNVRERVSILFPDKPNDWDLDFGNNSSEWTEFIEPQDRETIQIVLTVPEDAQGDETVDITISVTPTDSDQIPIVAHINVKQLWYQPFITLLVPLLLFGVIIVMVIVIYKRR
jgi:uncharacterized membrane protein